VIREYDMALTMTELVLMKKNKFNPKCGGSSKI
jgi:hypothetical protein